MASSIGIPELALFSPQSRPRRSVSLTRSSAARVSISRTRGRARGGLRLRPWIRAARQEYGAAVEERERELIEGGNGHAAAAERYSNGGVRVSESANGAAASNGSLVEYVNGNGNGNGVAAAATATAEVAVEVEDLEVKEEGRKKRIEEIGKEDAWFKQSGGQKVEVWGFGCFSQFFWIIFFPKSKWYLCLWRYIYIYIYFIFFFIVSMN